MIIYLFLTKNNLSDSPDAPQFPDPLGAQYAYIFTIQYMCNDFSCFMKPVVFLQGSRNTDKLSERPILKLIYVSLSC